MVFKFLVYDSFCTHTPIVCVLWVFEYFLSIPHLALNKIKMRMSEFGTICANAYYSASLFLHNFAVNAMNAVKTVKLCKIKSKKRHIFVFIALQACVTQLKRVQRYFLHNLWVFGKRNLDPGNLKSPLLEEYLQEDSELVHNATHNNELNLYLNNINYIWIIIAIIIIIKLRERM